MSQFVQSHNSPLSHNPFATLSKPFRIKCERYIFFKEPCSFVIIFDFASACICVYFYMYYGYTTIRHDWVGKVIHWKLCKKFKFYQTNKRYMHNPESVLDAQTPLGFWQRNGWFNLGLMTRPNNDLQKRENFSRKLKKLCNMKVTVIPNVIGALGTLTKGLVKGLEDLEIKE